MQGSDTNDQEESATTQSKYMLIALQDVLCNQQAASQWRFVAVFDLVLDVGFDALQPRKRRYKGQASRAWSQVCYGKDMGGSSGSVISTTYPGIVGNFESSLGLLAHRTRFGIRWLGSVPRGSISVT